MAKIMTTLREASEWTGLSYDILRKWCLEGRIAHVRAGKKILINWNKLCEYLETAGVEE